MTKTSYVEHRLVAAEKKVLEHTEEISANEVVVSDEKPKVTIDFDVLLKLVADAAFVFPPMPPLYGSAEFTSFDWNRSAELQGSSSKESIASNSIKRTLSYAEHIAADSTESLASNSSQFVATTTSLSATANMPLFSDAQNFFEDLLPDFGNVNDNPFVAASSSASPIVSHRDEEIQVRDTRASTWSSIKSSQTAATASTARHRPVGGVPIFTESMALEDQLRDRASSWRSARDQAPLAPKVKSPEITKQMQDELSLTLSASDILPDLDSFQSRATAPSIARSTLNNDRKSKLALFSEDDDEEEVFAEPKPVKVDMTSFTAKTTKEPVVELTETIKDDSEDSDEDPFASFSFPTINKIEAELSLPSLSLDLASTPISSATLRPMKRIQRRANIRPPGKI